MSDYLLSAIQKDQRTILAAKEIMSYHKVMDQMAETLLVVLAYEPHIPAAVTSSVFALSEQVEACAERMLEVIERT